MNLTYRTGGSSRSTTIAQLFTAKSQKWLTVADSCRTSGRPSAAYRLTHRIFGHSRAVRAHLDAAGTASINLRSAVSRLPYNLPAQLYTGRGTSCRTGQQVSAGLRPSGAHSEPLVTMGEPLPSPACPHRGPNWAGCAIDVRGLRSNGLRVLTTGDQLRAYVQRSRTEFNVGCRGQLGCAGRGVSIRSRELRLGDCASDRYALVGPGVHVDAGHVGSIRGMAGADRRADQADRYPSQSGGGGIRAGSCDDGAPALVTGIRGAIVVETASASNTAGTPP